MPLFLLAVALIVAGQCSPLPQQKAWVRPPTEEELLEAKNLMRSLKLED
jgi:hypothetical protein